VLIANATLGRVVDGGSVLLAAGGLVLVTGAGVAVTGLVGVPRHSTQGPGADEQWSLLLPSVLAAGTLPVLVAQGMGSPRYVDWVPAELAASNLVAALALVVVAVAAAVLLARSAVEVALGVALPVAALVVLLEPSGASWQVRDGAWVMGVVLALASAPLVLAAAAGRSGSWRRRAVAGAVLLAAGGLLAVVPQLLVLPILAGGTLGLAVTMPAGAVRELRRVAGDRRRPAHRGGAADPLPGAARSCGPDHSPVGAPRRDEPADRVSDRRRWRSGRPADR
jgi:hypothetical protein